MKSSIISAALLALVGKTVAAIPDVSNTLQNILKNTDGSTLYTYPTDLTRGIVPKPLHSHNDYWRDLPFYSALSYGAVSVEADVWLVNGTLYVGHEIQALTTNRTFDSLYVQPILDTLKRQNPTTIFSPTNLHNGVFDTSSGQTLYLWIDVKTDGATTWPVVLKALDPFIQGGWLTSYNGSSLTQGAVTVIGTGNTPLNQVQSPAPSAQNIRYAFYDAPIPYLNSTFSNITRFDSPIASTDFAAVFGNVVNQTLNDTQLATLTSQVKVAHDKGIKVRYWDLPAYPIGTRNAIWRILIDNGVDLINVDDLEGAAGFWENQG